MTEPIIHALVHLFAIIESAKEDTDRVNSSELIIKPFLTKHLNNNESLTVAYLDHFQLYLKLYKKRIVDGKEVDSEIDGLGILRITELCNELNRDLIRSDRMTVFIRLLELIATDQNVSKKEEEFAGLVALNFNLNQKDVTNLQNFILHHEHNKIDENRLLILIGRSSNWLKENHVPSPKVLYIKNLDDHAQVLHLHFVNFFVFKYTGQLQLYLDDSLILSNKFYILKYGATIRGENIETIHESEIKSFFIQNDSTTPVVITGKTIAYRFKNSLNGIKAFSFSEESGSMIGIMGGSGSGKTTLMKLLNGKITPNQGEIHINGFSLTQAALKGIIGYVPQEDFLVDELTVFQNLYFAARTCLGHFSETTLIDRVNEIIDELDLSEIKDLQVGEPLKKNISGGQRKRLNIAIELLREPSILFIDEPTSGLSSMDSEKMMFLLKDLTWKGKLIICIIHQPSPDIFRLFDKLWILDKGGYPVYNGYPIEAIVYFKTLNTQANAAESECSQCGNIIPEQILQIIEASEIDEKGKKTTQRRVSPEKWNKKYNEKVAPKLKYLKYKKKLPQTNFQTPNPINQFNIFFKRNIYTKIANKQYILINLLEAPLLACVLGYLSKFSADSEYIFSQNTNLPAYLFICIVVALFMGLTVSAQEIFKDRQILERESFLNLSKLAYINSKISFLFILSAIQTFSFVLIGNTILEIEGMLFYHWIVLFSTSCFANMVGLNISSSLNSVINIYILIPFILVPQMLLGGAMIKFEELHHSLKNKKNVPFVGDLMASRWAYEAIAVAQFSYNQYEKHFLEVEQQMSNFGMLRSYIIPELKIISKELLDDTSSHQTKSRKQLFKILSFELKKLSEKHYFSRFNLLDQLNDDKMNQQIYQQLTAYLENIQRITNQQYLQSQHNRDSIYQQLINKYGKNAYQNLRNNHQNKYLENLVRNRSQLKVVHRIKNQLIQKRDPIFTLPRSNIGRAHFYAPYKFLGNIQIPTYYFNILFIWFFSLFLYWTLLNNSLKKLILLFQNKLPGKITLK